MDLKLNQLHNAYDKHVFVGDKDGLKLGEGIYYCNCGIFSLDDTKFNLVCGFAQGAYDNMIGPWAKKQGPKVYKHWLEYQQLAKSVKYSYGPLSLKVLNTPME